MDDIILEERTRQKQQRERQVAAHVSRRADKFDKTMEGKAMTRLKQYSRKVEYVKNSLLMRTAA